MNLQRAIEKAAADPLKLALGAGLALGVVYLLGRQLVQDVGGVVGGVVSGDNAITRGTVYQGAGIPGTLGASTNAALGGVPERFGGWLGRTIYDLMHEDANLASDRRARELLQARGVVAAPPDEGPWYENLLRGLRP